MATRYDVADRLTKEMHAMGVQGRVEYAPANREYVIWPIGEPHSTAQGVRRVLKKLARERR